MSKNNVMILNGKLIINKISFKRMLIYKISSPATKKQINPTDI